MASSSASLSRVLDCSQPWRLSHVLPGHKSDVKAVAVARLNGQGNPGSTKADSNIELIQSASRDETARSWYRKVPQDRSETSAFEEAATYKGQRYQNAVTYCFTESGPADGMTIIGGLDSQIRVYDTKATCSDKPQSTPVQIINDHHDNVCHLSVKESTQNSERTLLSSSSWDCTSRIWAWHKGDQTWHSLHILKGHERAVWAAEIVTSQAGQERYLTASADLFVRLWHKETLTRVFAGHTDVVRSLVLLPPLSRPDASKDEATSANSKTPFYDEEELFASGSNDGSLRVWSLDDRRCSKGVPTSGGDALRVLQIDDGGSDLIYNACFAGLEQANGDPNTHDRIVATCGEGGLVRGWNIDEACAAFEIDQPVTSVWGIAALPASGDLVTANSDGFVRVYTQRKAPLEADAEGSTENRGMHEVSHAELEEHNALCEEVAMKRRKSRVRADIVAREGAENDAGQESRGAGKLTHTDGQEFDAILKIDVSDDAEPLSLPMNRGDDPRQRAHDFIAANNLPAVYEDQIVAFIEQVGPK